MEKIVAMESLLFQIRFPASGSLYFKGSLPDHVKRVDMPEHDQLCIGPSTETLWWYHKRDTLNIDRGPCMLSPSQLPFAFPLAYLTDL
jgi:hypothetical protein